MYSLSHDLCLSVCLFVCLFVCFDYCADSVDATREDPDFGFGRLLNHSLHNPNLVPHKIVVDRTPHIVMIAGKDIEANSELVYDYGDRDPTTLEKHAWLAGEGELADDSRAAVRYT